MFGEAWPLYLDYFFGLCSLFLLKRFQDLLAEELFSQPSTYSHLGYLLHLLDDAYWAPYPDSGRCRAILYHGLWHWASSLYSSSVPEKILSGGSVMPFLIGRRELPLCISILIMKRPELWSGVYEAKPLSALGDPPPPTSTMCVAATQNSLPHFSPLQCKFCCSSSAAMQHVQACRSPKLGCTALEVWFLMALGAILPIYRTLLLQTEPWSQHKPSLGYPVFSHGKQVGCTPSAPQHRPWIWPRWQTLSTREMVRGATTHWGQGLKVNQASF